jgi:hypothetical protein
MPMLGIPVQIALPALCSPSPLAPRLCLPKHMFDELSCSSHGELNTAVPMLEPWRPRSHVYADADTDGNTPELLSAMLSLLTFEDKDQDHKEEEDHLQSGPTKKLGLLRACRAAAVGCGAGAGGWAKSSVSKIAIPGWGFHLHRMGWLSWTICCTVRSSARALQFPLAVYPMCARTMNNMIQCPSTTTLMYCRAVYGSLVSYTFYHIFEVHKQAHSPLWLCSS